MDGHTINARVARILQGHDHDRIRRNLDRVVESVYRRLPAGDYGRGDVRAGVLNAIKRADSPPRKGDASPWGIIETVTPQPQGCVLVSTASHGGVWVPADKLHLIPSEFRAYGAKWAKGWGDQWYEEDVAAIAPMAYVERGEYALKAVTHLEQRVK